MTRVVDFRISKWLSGPQKGQESLWSFKLAGDTSQLFSQLWRLPKTQAFYYEWRWEVVPSQYILDLLRTGTQNFDRAYQAARKKWEEEWTLTR